MREYLSLLNSEDVTRRPISKKRTCFGWKDECLVIDTFTNLEVEFSLLRVITPPVR